MTARARVADLAGVVCLATDLGMGFPFEHGLQATLAVDRLCSLVGADTPTRTQAYYASLLAYAGCTSESADNIGTVEGSQADYVIPYIWGSMPEQLRGLLRAIPDPEASPLATLGQRLARLPKAARALPDHQRGYCDVAATMAERLGLPQRVSAVFHHLTDRWDGTGILRRGKGADIPFAVRLMWVARDATYLEHLWGREKAVAALQARSGNGHDPRLVETLVAHLEEVLVPGPEETAWDAVMAAEPHPHLTVAGDELDRALGAVGDFADLLSPWLSGHSSGTAELAARAADHLGLDRAGVELTRRAAMVHDLGRVGVEAPLWSKATPLTADERERVRLHPYLTERVLVRSASLAPLAEAAACHHERMDGSGYHRGLGGAMLSRPARLVAAADVFRALTQPRAHRRPMAPGAAADVLLTAVHDGQLDADAVAAVLAAAGQRRGRPPRPAGLTEREAQVLGLLARGFATKQVARTLGITAKTADHHVQAAYRKTGVSSRAGATLVAMEHGLVAWGELPMGTHTTRP